MGGSSFFFVSRQRCRPAPTLTPATQARQPAPGRGQRSPNAPSLTEAREPGPDRATARPTGPTASGSLGYSWSRATHCTPSPRSLTVNCIFRHCPSRRRDSETKKIPGASLVTFAHVDSIDSWRASDRASDRASERQASERVSKRARRSRSTPTVKLRELANQSK